MGKINGLFLKLMVVFFFFVALPAASASSTIWYKQELPILALTSNPTDAQTIYFGRITRAPTTTAATSKIIIPEGGTITAVYLYTYSGTAGTNEAWAAKLRVNNANDYDIATVSAAANERVFQVTNLDIDVTEVNTFVEIKMVNPNWGTNPATTLIGGFIEVNCSITIPDPTVTISLPVFNFTANLTVNNTFSPVNNNNFTGTANVSYDNLIVNVSGVGGSSNMTGDIDLSLFTLLTVIPIFFTALIFVFRRFEYDGLAFVAAIISWVAWVSVGVIAVVFDVSYSIGIVFLYCLCAVPGLLLMIALIPETWKKPKSEV